MARYCLGLQKKFSMRWRAEREQGPAQGGAAVQILIPLTRRPLRGTLLALGALRLFVRHSLYQKPYPRHLLARIRSGSDEMREPFSKRRLWREKYPRQTGHQLAGPQKPQRASLAGCLSGGWRFQQVVTCGRSLALKRLISDCPQFYGEAPFF